MVIINLIHDDNAPVLPEAVQAFLAAQFEGGSYFDRVVFGDNRESVKCIMAQHPVPACAGVVQSLWERENADVIAEAETFAADKEALPIEF